MINYVNNAYDKVLKPCDAQRFSIIVNSQETERLILAHRGGDEKAKAKLPAITYMGVFDEEKYNAYLKTHPNGSQARLLGADKSAVVATEASFASAPCMGRTHTSRKQGTRKAEFMRPTGLLMLDFDHVQNQTQTPSNLPLYGEASQASRTIIDSPMKLWEYIQEKLSAMTAIPPHRGGDARRAEGGCLAHITPSGDGLRVVVKRTKGTTIEQEQYEWCKAMKLDAIGIKPDPACKDISRLSFAPMQSEVLYYNPSLLFAELPEAADYPDGTLWGGDSLRATLGTPSAPQSSARPSINRGTVSGATLHPEGEHQQTPPLFIEGVPEGRGSSKQSAERYPTDYDGIEYSSIVSRLEEQLGGRPERGARNSFIFTMACNLRYICDDNAEWVASILPTYGEDQQKHRMTIQSAINRPMSKTMPETLKRALNVAKMCSEGDNSEFKIQNSASAPEMPSALPEPIALLTSRTPEKMKPAVAMSVFPPLGAHLRDVRFSYWDGREYEPTFMHLLVAELSSGKSAVNTPIEYILADIEARDSAALEKEKAWRDKCANIANPQDKPERPKGLVVQVLPSDMTNAAFVQRLADAEGRFLYTQMDEVELLDALKTNGRAGAVSAVLRLAFDCGKYGQVRVAANAVNAMVRIRWNWNASSTVQRVRKYFAKSIADGTLSRLSFSTIIKDKEDAYGRNRPKFLPYGEHFADELRPYIDALNTCKGTLHCPEAMAWAEALCDELADFAEEMEDETYATMSFRAVLMGFFRAMVLYVMNGMQWSSVIADFAAWSVKYDLWCKMRFFSDMLHKDLEGEKSAMQRGPVGLLALLPQEFTRQQLQDLRVAQGMKPNPRGMLGNWVSRGLIVRDETREVYVKIES